jgi:5'-3' exonuclease
MGIPNFLSHILNSAGREIELQNFASRKEPLRVAIDVSTWIHRACFTHSDMLADEKHLNNYGRATLLLQDEQNQLQSFEEGETPATGPPISEKEKQLLDFVSKSCSTVIENIKSFQESTKAEVLVVLDGATPPIKATTVAERNAKRKIEQVYRDLPVDTTAQSPILERRLQANRRSGAGEHYGTVIEAIIISLRSNKIPFIVAPYEADAQLAFLQIKGCVDLIIADDSDLVVYGLASPLLYRISKNSEGTFSRGVLLRKNDLSASFPGCFPKNPFDLMDFSPPMMACLFASLGCDYCRKLRGIGTAMACRLVRAAFFPTKPSSTENSCCPLERLLKSLLDATWDRSTLTEDERIDFQRDFLAAVFMYRHAMVFDPIEVGCRSMIPLSQAEVELASYGPYAAILRNEYRVSQIIGRSFPPQIASHIAEGWVCPKSLSIRKHVTAPANVQGDLDRFLVSQNMFPEDPIEKSARAKIFPPSGIAVEAARRAGNVPSDDEPNTQMETYE